MITIAYNKASLHNLSIVKEAKQWQESSVITKEQLDAIRGTNVSSLYHPNVFIRVLLFLATLIALSGITGLLGLILMDIIEHIIFFACIMHGAVSLVVLEQVFIKQNQHYKSGVTEALLYHSIGFLIVGLGGLIDFQEHALFAICLVIFTLSAIRYVDLISTICALGSFIALLFITLFQAGGIVQLVVPFIFMIVFVALYIAVKKLRGQEHFEDWQDCLIITEALSLIGLYASGNYFVVREMSVAWLNLYLEPDQNIPFAYFFYAFTVIMPSLYLYFGIKRKDIVLIRVSLFGLAFAVFTFKYYFSLGHHEITFTISGLLLLITALALFRYLKQPRKGYTHENVLKEKWAEANPEAFIISQTLGGNAVSVDQVEQGGGGKSGGAGSSESW